MEPNAVPVWGEMLIFPDYLFEECTSDELYPVTVGKTENSASFTGRGSQGNKVISFSEGKLIRDQVEFWRAFRALTFGAKNAFLVRDPADCVLDNELIATGDGVQKTFAVVRKTQVQGKTYTRPIKYIDHAYPARFWPTADAHQPRRIWPVRHLRVFVNGVEQVAGWTLDRMTGLITFAVAPALGALITVSGYYLTPVHFGDAGAPLVPRGGGVFELGSIELIEPRGAR